MTNQNAVPECSCHPAKPVSSQPEEDDGGADFAVADRTAVVWALRQSAALLQGEAGGVQ